jgi:hypothetical protein
MIDAVLIHPRCADEAVLCESILGLENIELAACDEVLMALLQGIARARGVELVGFVEEFERAAHVQVLCVAENRKRHTESKRLEELFV